MSLTTLHKIRHFAVEGRWKEIESFFNESLQLRQVGAELGSVTAGADSMTECSRAAGFGLKMLAGLVLAGFSGASGADDVRPWTEYRTIMWIGDSAFKKPEKLPLFFQRLREMGINAGMVTGCI